MLQNAQGWGGDATRVALAGESAGGDLAVATAVYARDNELPKAGPFYPIANSDMGPPSRRDAAEHSDAELVQRLRDNHPSGPHG